MMRAKLKNPDCHVKGHPARKLLAIAKLTGTPVAFNGELGVGTCKGQHGMTVDIGRADVGRAMVKICFNYFKSHFV